MATCWMKVAVLGLLFGLVPTASPTFTCNTTNIDLLFIIHPLFDTAWPEIVSYVSNVVGGFSIGGGDGVRVALISYGTPGVEIPIRLGQYTDKTALRRAIENVTSASPFEDWCRPIDALDVARKQVFPGAGSAGVHRYVVLASDDPPVIDDDLATINLVLQALHRLRDESNVQVLLVSVVYELLYEFGPVLDLLMDGFQFEPIGLETTAELAGVVDQTIRTLCPPPPPPSNDAPVAVSTTQNSATQQVASLTTKAASLTTGRSTPSQAPSASANNASTWLTKSPVVTVQRSANDATTHVQIVVTTSTTGVEFNRQDAELPTYAVVILSAGGGAALVLIIVLGVFLIKIKIFSKTPQRIKIDANSQQSGDCCTDSSFDVTSCSGTYANPVDHYDVLREEERSSGRSTATDTFSDVISNVTSEP